MNEENSPTPFSPNQALFAYTEKHGYLRCSYVQHVRGEVHVVKMEEGECQGTHYKYTEELYTENPLSKN